MLAFSTYLLGCKSTDPLKYYAPLQPIELGKLPDKIWEKDEVDQPVGLALEYASTFRPNVTLPDLALFANRHRAEM